MSNMQSLLDSSLDDLADLPEFAVLPNGVHRVALQFAEKEVNGHPSVEMKMTVRETIELANPAADQPCAPGTESSVLFMLDNEFGQGKLKEVLKPLAAATGVGQIGQLLQAANGMEVTVTAKVRQNKDKTQSYTDVTKLEV